MNTTTLLTGVSATAGTTVATVNKDRTINTKRLKNILITGAVTSGTSTTTAIVESSIKKSTMDRIHMEYTRSYVESMTDEELERALLALNLVENDSNNNVKIV